MTDCVAEGLYRTLAAEMVRLYGKVKIAQAGWDVGKPASDTRVPDLPAADQARIAGEGNAQLVLRAAKRLFLDHGFDGVNLDRISKAAGVTRQTVYNRFGSKEAVFRSMIEMHWATIAKDTEAVLAVSLDPALGAAAVLRRFGEAIVSFVVGTDQIAFTRLVISESHARPWIAEDFYRLGRQPLLNACIACLQRLSDARLIEYIEPAIAAHQFFGMIQEMVIWPYVMAIGPSVAELPREDRVVEEAVLTFLSRYSTFAGSTAGSADV